MVKKELVRILCGSHLYGTNVEGSDEDLKTVFVPSGRDILLQRAKSISNTTSVEQDVEQFPIQRFLELLKGGQTVALDMLFAPLEFYRGEPAPEWEKLILHNRSQLVSKNVKSFIGYCRQQSSKYCIKVERYYALKDAVSWLRAAHESFNHLRDIPDLQEWAQSHPFTEIVEIPNAQGKLIPHLSICGTMIPFGARVFEAYQLFSSKSQRYGERVHRAANMGEKDWKALYHAVRVAYQAQELLQTGKITFPREERDYLLAIRKGQVPYEEVRDVLECGVEFVEKAAKTSSLQEEVNAALIENLTVDIHLVAIREEV